MIIVLFFSNMLRTARNFLIGWYFGANEPLGNPSKSYSKMYSPALG